MGPLAAANTTHQYAIVVLMIGLGTHGAHSHTRRWVLARALWGSGDVHRLPQSCVQLVMT
jgi:hypothetical protein